MKQHLILATMVALSAISCSKPHGDAPPEVKVYFRGKVNGVFFSDSTQAGVTSCCQCPRCGPPIPSIAGKSPVGWITFYFGSWPGAGEVILGYPWVTSITITLDNGQPFFAGYKYLVSQGVETWQGSGKVTILETTGTPYMKGTFECIAPADSTVGIFPPITITEGEFNLKY